MSDEKDVIVYHNEHTSGIDKYDKNLKYVNKIKKNELYHIRRPNRKVADATFTGDQLIDNFGVKKWTEFLNLGYLPGGNNYEIFKATGPGKFQLVFEGATQILGNAQGTNNSSGMNDNTMPMPVLPKNPNEHTPNKAMDMFNKSLADIVNNSSRESLGALQETMQEITALNQQLQNQCDLIRREYETKLDEERERYQQLQEENVKFLSQIETLKRDLDNERWKVQMEDKFRTEKEEFLQNQKNPVDKLAELADKFGPMIASQMMKNNNSNIQMAKAPVQQMTGSQNYQQRKMDNVEYTEGEHDE